MLTTSQAIAAANAYLERTRVRPEAGDDVGFRPRLFVTQERCTEAWFGWVFDVQYESDAGAPPNDALLGQGPLVVTNDGDVVSLTSAIPPNQALRAFEERRRDAAWEV
jgi:hypothetical protein